MAAKKMLTVRAAPESVARVDELASRLGVDRSVVLRRILGAGLVQAEEELAKAPPVIADLLDDAGRQAVLLRLELLEEALAGIGKRVREIKKEIKGG